MSAGPDIAGLYAALRRLPDRTPEQREAYAQAGLAHRASQALASGRRYAARDWPGRAHGRHMKRDPRTGRFVKA